MNIHTPRLYVALLLITAASISKAENWVEVPPSFLEARNRASPPSSWTPETTTLDASSVQNIADGRVSFRWRTSRGSFEETRDVVVDCTTMLQQTTIQSTQFLAGQGKPFGTPIARKPPFVGDGYLTYGSTDWQAAVLGCSRGGLDVDMMEPMSGAQAKCANPDSDFTKVYCHPDPEIGGRLRVALFRSMQAESLCKTDDASWKAAKTQRNGGLATCSDDRCYRNGVYQVEASYLRDLQNKGVVFIGRSEPGACGGMRFALEQKDSEEAKLRSESVRREKFSIYRECVRSKSAALDDRISPADIVADGAHAQCGDQFLDVLRVEPPFTSAEARWILLEAVRPKNIAMVLENRTKKSASREHRRHPEARPVAGADNLKALSK